MNVKDFLNARRISYTVYVIEPTFDAQHLAEALHVPGGNVAKAVLLRLNGVAEYAIAVVPASATLDLRRVSGLLDGAVVELATPCEVFARDPDLEFGIVPPFGSLLGVDTIVDESLTRHYDVFFQGDTHCEAVRMKYSDYFQIEHPRVMSIVRHAHAVLA